MNAATFLATHRVQTNLLHVADLSLWSSEGAHTQRVWLFTLTHNDGLNDRMLALDWRTSATDTIATMDVADIVATLAVDAHEGNRSFNDYLYEHYDPQRPASPAEHYAQWIKLVRLWHQFEDWCGNDEMRMDFFAIPVH